MNERETLQYKTELLRSHKSEVGPSQAKQLFFHPARTKGEIDRAFEGYAREYSTQRAQQNAQFTKERQASTRTDPDSNEAEPTDEAAGRSAKKAHEDAERLSSPPRSDSRGDNTRSDGIPKNDTVK